MSSVATGKRNPEKSRRKILRAARAEFSQHGLDGARTSQIARRAGVPKGLLYHYFDSKDALLDAALDDALEPFYRAAADLVENPGTEHPGELFSKSILMYFGYLEENPEVAALMAWWTASRRWEVNSRSEWMAASKRLREQAAKLVRRGQENGVIRKELEAAVVVRLPFDLCLYWHQYWGWAAAERGIDVSDKKAVKALHAERVKQIVDFVLNAVLSRP